jgi:hyperosmotically inducible periplasmic protein
MSTNSLRTLLLLAVFAAAGSVAAGCGHDPDAGVTLVTLASADAATSQQVRAELADYGIDHQAIQIETANGTVTLLGSVGTPAERTAAEAAARAVAGVRAVRNELSVGRPLGARPAARPRIS